MRTFRDARAMAKAVREALSSSDIAVSHAQALEIVARQFGLANWNILAARIDADQPSATGDTPDATRFEQAVPIVRIFDIAKSEEFYLGFLGFAVDWDHRFGENFPLYRQVSRAGLTLHLSEHAGDATPGGNMVVATRGLRAFQQQLSGKNYRYLKPGLSEEEWGLEMQVTDPFNNRIRFIERLKA